jgi:hypothetical protein
MKKSTRIGYVLKIVITRETVASNLFWRGRKSGFDGLDLSDCDLFTDADSLMTAIEESSKSGHSSCRLVAVKQIIKTKHDGAVVIKTKLDDSFNKVIDYGRIADALDTAIALFEIANQSPV